MPDAAISAWTRASGAPSSTSAVSNHRRASPESARDDQQRRCQASANRRAASARPPLHQMGKRAAQVRHLGSQIIEHSLSLDAGSGEKCLDEGDEIRSVGGTDRLDLTAGGELLQRELADRLQHPEAARQLRARRLVQAGRDSCRRAPT